MRHNRSYTLALNNLLAAPPMPNNNSRDTLIRQWSLLQSIPREPGAASSQQIHAKLKERGYAVTPRTVERDLRKLEQAGFPLVVDESQQPFLWSWSRSAPALMLPMPTISEAVLLVAARDYLKPVLPPALMAALAPTMDNAAAMLASAEKSNEMARWRNKVRVALPNQPLIAPTVAPNVLEPICTALMQETQVEITYRSRSVNTPGEEIGAAAPGASAPDAKGKTRKLLIHPHALIHRGIVSYLVGVCEGYSDMRLFALHRIKAAKNTYSSMQVSPGFKLDDYLSEGFADFGDGERKVLKAHIAPEVAAHLLECKLSTDQTLKPLEKPAGWFELRATVMDTPQLTWWLRAYGDKVVW